MMQDGLVGLPQELFESVTDQLSRADLKALSETAKGLRARLFTTLFQSIKIEPRSEYAIHNFPTDLPLPCLQNARLIRFRSGVQNVISRRCPHNGKSNDDGKDDSQTSSIQGEKPSPYSVLEDNAASILRRIEDGQLEEFSWDLGTCIPPKILGTGGILPHTQPQIRSLSLTTDSTCEHQNSDVDLSAFRQLRQFRWKAPGGSTDYRAFITVLRQNSLHLEALDWEVANTPWTALKADDFFGEEEFERIHIDNYLCDFFEELSICSPEPILQNLCDLTLTQVSVTAGLAMLLNFSVLKSLKLRLCPRWDWLLDCSLPRESPICLKTFELVATKRIEEINDLGIIRVASLLDFLCSFRGLEELYICRSETISIIKLWEQIAPHHSDTLKRFVHHMRTMNEYTGDGPPGSTRPGEEHDARSFLINKSEMNELKRNPAQNPLKWFELEFLGLACRPERIKPLLLPFQSKTLIKCIHIRQSVMDLALYTSWGVRGSGSQVKWTADDDFSASTSGWSSAGEFSDNEEDAVLCSSTADRTTDAIRGRGHGRSLRGELRQFVEWAFGPHGIAPLQVVAFGDFSYGGRHPDHAVIMCRNTDQGTRYRLVDWGTREWFRIQEEYPSLTACPTRPFLTENDWDVDHGWYD